jgi:hypothetical protein
MTNPHYVRSFDVLEGSSNRSDAVEAEFLAVQAGFDSVEARLDTGEAYDAELVAARQGQASLALNLARYLSTFAAATGNLDLGGFLVRNAGAPLLAGDLATKAYVDDVRAYATGLSFTTALPGQNPGVAGLPVVTDGATASWGLPHFAHIALLNAGIF